MARKAAVAAPEEVEVEDTSSIANYMAKGTLAESPEDEEDAELNSVLDDVLGGDETSGEEDEDEDEDEDADGDDGEDEKAAAPAVSEEDLENIEVGKNFVEAWEKDPVLLMKGLIKDQLSPKDRAALLKELGAVDAGDGAGDAEGDDDVDEEFMPSVVRKNRDWITSGQKIVGEQIGQLNQVAYGAATEVSTVKVLVEAFADILGIEVPTLDRAQLVEDYKKTGDVEKAVRAQLEAKVKTAAAKAKQNGRQRPVTPGSTGGKPALKGGDIKHYVAAIAQRNV